MNWINTGIGNFIPAGSCTVTPCYFAEQTGHDGYGDQMIYVSGYSFLNKIKEELGNEKKQSLPA